jgi:hypothetical protein
VSLLAGLACAYSSIVYIFTYGRGFLKKKPMVVKSPLKKSIVVERGVSRIL